MQIRQTLILLSLVLAAMPATTLAQRPPRPPIPSPMGRRPRPTPPPTVEEKAEEEVKEPSAGTTQRQKAFAGKRGRYSLTFDRTDIVEVVKTISNYTGKNFILPDNVRGKITIISQTKVSADEVYAAFLASLEANNLAVYPVGNKFLKILPKKDAQRANIPTFVGDEGNVPWNEQMVTKLFRLEHTDADQMSGIMKSLISRDGEVQTVPPDLLIVTDVGLNLHRIEKIVAQIDQAGGAGELRIIQVKYASAVDIAAKLAEIFEIGQQRGGAAPRARRPRQAKGAPPTPGATGGEGELEVSISRAIADERTNKLIVAADEKSFRKIQQLLDELDVPTEAEGQVHVHYLTNANAEELASTLSNLAQGGNQVQRPGRPRPPVGRGSDASVPGVESAELFAGEVKISADKGTNSLVIVASYNDYKSLAKVIEKLDIPRRQVFVEAVIMEVSLDTTDEFGMTFHSGAAPPVGGEGDVAPVILGTQFGGANSLSIGSLLGFGGFLAGIQGPPVPGTEGLPISIPSFGVVLHALQRDSHVNVLSTPHILTSDNEEAEITVGQNVPFQSGFAPGGISNLLSGSNINQTNQSNVNSALSSFAGGLGGLGSFFAPIQRQNVELKLKLTPQINESDYVRLAIEEQTEEIASTDPQLGPTTARRTAKTTVVARDGQTVVIGGLIQERSLESVNKVPILGDIPVIGWLFRSTELKTLKTNLLLFLTPHIIKDESDFRRIFEQKLHERQQFVEQFYGLTEDFGGRIDFARKQGPLAHVHRTVTEELAAPENGGPGAGVTVFEPQAPESTTPMPEPYEPYDPGAPEPDTMEDADPEAPDVIEEEL